MLFLGLNSKNQRVFFQHETESQSGSIVIRHFLVFILLWLRAVEYLFFPPTFALYIYIYIHTRGSLNKFPDFFRMGTFIDSTHMKL